MKKYYIKLFLAAVISLLKDFLTGCVGPFLCLVGVILILWGMVNLIIAYPIITTAFVVLIGLTLAIIVRMEKLHNSQRRDK